MKNQIFKKLTAYISAAMIVIIAFLDMTQITYAETQEWPAPPTTLAGSAILIDVDTGAILYDKNSHSKMYPASTTKIMTGLLTIENCGLDEEVTFSKQAANSVKWDESNIGTKPGETYTVSQALHALLLSSANEVAYGLGEYVAGTIPSFVDMMNARAKELGALNTHFNNASGLFDPDHYTTAYDLAMIGKACFSNQTFLSIDSYSGSYKIEPTNLTNTARTLAGKHLMLKNRAYYYEYFKGGKTGYTDESLYTLITYAEKDGMRLICVVFKETNEANRYIDTKALFDYGFNNFKKTSISNSDVSSLFNNSNYYNSKVFNNTTIDFSMNASSVTLPNAATLSDIELTLNTDEKNEDKDNNDFSSKLNFTYKENIVGSANLSVNTKSTIVKSENLPYLTNSNVTTPTSKNCFVINLWYLAVAILSISILYFIFTKTKQDKRKNRNKYGKSKLHY